MINNPENYLIAVAKTLQNTKYLEIAYKQKRCYINPPIEIEERGIVLLQRPFYFRQLGNLFLPNGSGSTLRKGAPINEQIWDGKLAWTLRAEEKGITYERAALSQSNTSLALLEPLQGFFDTSQSHLAQVKKAQKQGFLISLRLDKTEKYEGILCQIITYTLKKKEGQDFGQEQITLTINPQYRVLRTKKSVISGDVTTEEETFLTYKSINKPLSKARFQVVLPPDASIYKPPAPLLLVNTPAPNFTGMILRQEKALNVSKEISLTQYRGNVVLLDFWAPWCVPCVKVFPRLQEIATRYKKTDKANGLIVLMIPLWDTPENVRQWFKKNATNYPDLVFMMGDANTDLIGNLYHVSSIPMQYIIDPDGQITNVNPSENTLDSLINQLLIKKQ
jgi:thiol-disulfide isomerase/thioredoxin